MSDLGKPEYIEGKWECVWCGSRIPVGCFLREDGRYLVVTLVPHVCEEEEWDECEELGEWTLEELKAWEVVE